MVVQTAKHIRYVCPARGAKYRRFPPYSTQGPTGLRRRGRVGALWPNRSSIASGGGSFACTVGYAFIYEIVF